MKFINLVKLFHKRYRVKFIGQENNLHKYLEIVVHDPFVYFNFSSGFWEINKDDVNEFLSNHKDLDIEVESKKPKIVRYDKALDEIGLTMKLKPYMYQREAIKFALDKKNALIILPCGSGKKLPS